MPQINSEYVNTALLVSSADAIGINLSEDEKKQFCTYASLLCEWNNKMNLTAVTDPDGIAVTHFADSLTLEKAVEIKNGASVIDIGSGAGFPSIPVLITRPDIHLTLLDSLNKRLTFLDELLGSLKLSAKTVHFRAEDAARDESFREKFDLVTARAVAALPALCEYCLPFVKVGGVFAAMKGPGADDELNDAEKAISLLGGQLGEVKKFTLANGSERNIIIIKKVLKTPSKYPRTGTKITKKPL